MWKLAGREFSSRLLLGTAKYPSPQELQMAVNKSGAEILTVSLRRQSADTGQDFWNFLQDLKVQLLPNTAGCRSAKEAITTAQMAREIFGTHWIKIETVGDEFTLQPDPFALVEASRVLINEGFEVFPYMTEDLVVAERLVSAGCRILMPWGSQIGSGQGILHHSVLKTMRARYPELTLIIDAGIGCPSDAAEAMELGFDGVLLNSAVSQAQNPVLMAEAFSLAIKAGRMGHQAGLMPNRQFAQTSTPTLGIPFWHHETSQ